MVNFIPRNAKSGFAIPSQCAKRGQFHSANAGRCDAAIGRKNSAAPASRPPQPIETTAKFLNNPRAEFAIVGQALRLPTPRIRLGSEALALQRHADRPIPQQFQIIGILNKLLRLNGERGRARLVDQHAAHEAYSFLKNCADEWKSKASPRKNYSSRRLSICPARRELGRA